MSHLLIAGLPGTGKSHFSRWLAEVHGYVHIEVEPVDPDPAVLALLDDRALNVAPVAQDLLGRSDDVVLDWRVTPAMLGRVRQLVRAGFEPWWFGGDVGAASKAFRSKGGNAAVFERQLHSTRAAKDRIEHVFAGHVLSTVESRGEEVQHVSPEQIYAWITADR